MIPSSAWSYSRRALSFALFTAAFGLIAFLFSNTSLSRPAVRETKLVQPPSRPKAPAPLAEGTIPVIIELRDEPGVLRKLSAAKAGKEMSVQEVANYSLNLYQKQNEFRSALAAAGLNAVLRENDVRQLDGSIRHIEYRFHYLLNGFVAYINKGDLKALRARPEVLTVHELPAMDFKLDKAVDYVLGPQASITDRRDAVYGLTKEFSPVPTTGHAETPNPAHADGYEGQGMNVAVIDSGIDFRHPMFGGIGLTTPLPRISGNAPSASDNQKVIYYYALSSPGEITDDFGHGTLVSSCVAGYKVDGTTPANPGYGFGKDGTGVGPVPNGATLHGTAPQARLMAYKVCGPAPQCAGDTELAIEDAASPVTLVGQNGVVTPTAVAKPVADVINLSLGDTAGDPTSASSKEANNAVLAGVIVVASAGNAGPGPSTLGAPSVGTLAISVAAGTDPGSLGNSALLANPILADTRTPGTAGPAPITGAASEALPAGAVQSIKLFPVAGSGAVPNGSLSAHYVYVDEAAGAPSTSVTNRIALVSGTGTFANIANEVAPLQPAAILIITDVQSATALVVAGSIPTYTISVADANALLDNIGGGYNHSNVPNNTISILPLRVSESTPANLFTPEVAGFSSRGPEGNANAHYRAIKPDVIGPGVAVYGAATPTGLQEAATGLSNPSGYVQASGTSFSGPITAGAMALIRQRVREELNLDTTNQSDPSYTSKRFNSAVVARALLQNAATNLRNGLGVPQADGLASPSVNDMGSGLVNLTAALQAKAIMVAPTLLDTDEYNPASTTPAPTPIPVVIPTVSFGEVPVVGVNGVLTRKHEVIIRDVTNGGGAGTYNLAYQNNRNTAAPGATVTFLAADGVTSTTSVNVPVNGQASYFVQIAVDGTVVTADPTELQWYVTATKGAQVLRMPFYYRAIKPALANITQPTQTAITGNEQTGNPCVIDTNGNFTINFTYTTPTGGPLPVGFQVQEATQTSSIYSDDASEPLVGGANSKWTGSAQWVTQPRPTTTNPAYYIADGAMQDESLAMVAPISLPPGGVTFSFTTVQDLEDAFDFGYVEVSTDGGTNFSTLASYTGAYSGSRSVDLSSYAGQSVIVRFRLKSDLFNAGAPTGWYVDDINISADNFHTIAQPSANATSYNVTNRLNGTYYYRVAALFSTPQGTIAGPYSLVRCVTVQVPTAVPSSVVSRLSHNGTPYDIPLPLTGGKGIECRVDLNQPQAYKVVFSFPANVSVSGAQVTSGTGSVASFTPSGTQIEVNLTGVTNAQTIVVSLFGITGATTGNVSVPMGVLLGDVTASGRVDSGDATVVRQNNLQSPAANPRADVNASGLIDSGDVTIVRQQNLTSLPQ